ncbi:MAG: KOW domain-containing RNA-binding protein [Heliobacteriaceae bacterium]|nr:KOW domain-containing RNA-binding protein [Heliobacteriaceae bacterium]MDD4587985.1 KOW domain-containing RNA-binding protein [Heliobacteriaceae bacterium]
MALKRVIPGELVLSRAGRDKDRYFLVLKLGDPNFLYIADGQYRKVENLKRKKLKHLQLTGLVATEIRQILQMGKTPTNAQVIQALDNLRNLLEVGSDF